MGLEKFASLVPERKYLLSEESAKLELGKLMTFYDIDLSEVSVEQEAAVGQILQRLLSAFRAGKLELKDDPEKGLSIIQAIRNGDTLTYRQIRGSDKSKLGTAGDDPTRRLHYLGGILSSEGIDVIERLQAADLKISEAVSAFFIVLC